MGVELCSPDVAFTSATVRNRPQPSATLRKCPREGRMAVPIRSSAKGITLGVFQRRVASFRVAGMALRDIQIAFCVTGAILLLHFQKMR